MIKRFNTQYSSFQPTANKVLDASLQYKTEALGLEKCTSTTLADLPERRKKRGVSKHMP